MADLPYFPLFTSDWVRDTKFLTLHEQGALLQLVCAMHESQVRGYLLFNGGPMPPDRIARILGIDRQPALDVLDRLLESSVLQKDPESGVVFYPVMVKREKLRKTRQENGKKGASILHRPTFAIAKPEQVPKQTVEYGSDSGNGSEVSDSDARDGSPESLTPTLPDVLTEASMRGILPVAAEAFWNAMEACGWIDRAQRPVVKWKPALTNWATSWRANENKQKLYGNGNNQTTKPNARNVGITGDAEERTRRVVETVARRQREAVESTSNGVATAEP